MSVRPKQNWESYFYNTDQGPVVVGFHADAKQVDQAKYPLCARVMITIKAPESNGGPSEKEAAALAGIEDRLVELLDAANVPCLLLGRLTHNGTRELAFQVADYETFRPPFEKWLNEISYEADISEHDGWDFFFQFVWPSETAWMYIADRKVVDKLVESGSDVSKTHALEFVFRGNRFGLMEMQDSLAGRGYTLVKFSEEETRLIMSRTMTLDVGKIFREGLSHREDCRRLGIEYDGWGAQAVA